MKKSLIYILMSLMITSCSEEDLQPEKSSYFGLVKSVTNGYWGETRTESKVTYYSQDGPLIDSIFARLDSYPDITSKPAELEEYLYNSKGLLSQIRNGYESTTISYDSLNRIISTTEHIEDIIGWTRISDYNYRSDQEIECIVNAFDSYGSSTDNVLYKINDEGLIISKSVNGIILGEYTYDDDGDIISKTSFLKSGDRPGETTKTDIKKYSYYISNIPPMSNVLVTNYHSLAKNKLNQHLLFSNIEDFTSHKYLRTIEEIAILDESSREINFEYVFDEKNVLVNKIKYRDDSTRKIVTHYQYNNNL